MEWSEIVANATRGPYEYFYCNPVVSDSLRAVIYRAAEFFEPDEVADVSVTMDNFPFPGGAYYPDEKAVRLSLHLAFSDPADVLFVVIHELRHHVQYSRGMLKLDKVEETNVWRDGYTVPISDILVMLHDCSGRSDDLYVQLPWEADANGYAHHAMSSYVPKDPFLANAVKFCTLPEEFTR
jgi:hypothetical protein